jgi:hypothetical protein
VPVIRGHVCLAETTNEPEGIRSSAAVIEFHSECSCRRKGENTHGQFHKRPTCLGKT